MMRIFACKYATPDEGAEAVTTWIKASEALGAPLKSWSTAPMGAGQSKSLRKDLGASQGWKVTISKFKQEYWSVLLTAAIAKAADPGLKGEPAAQQMHARNLGTALRLLQIQRAGTEYLASATSSDTPGSWFLFDPKTGLWQVGDNDVDDFCNHMEANYKGADGMELRAWVAPIPVKLHTTWIGSPASDNKDILCASELGGNAKYSADIRPQLRFCCLRQFGAEFKNKLNSDVELVFLEDALPALDALANGGTPLAQPDFNNLEASTATILWEFTKYFRTKKGEDKRFLAFAKDIWSLYCLYKFGGYHFDAGVSVLDRRQPVNLSAPRTLGAMLAMERGGGTAAYVHLSAADYSGSANAGLKCMFVSFHGHYPEQTNQKFTGNVINVPEIDTIDVPVLRSPSGDAGIKRALQTYIYLWFALMEAGVPMIGSDGLPTDAFRVLSVSGAATGITHWAPYCPVGEIPPGSLFAIEREMNLKKLGYGTHR